MAIHAEYYARGVAQLNKFWCKCRMDLDLERFWKVVRPKRHPPRPKPAKESIQVYVEAAESSEGAPCTRRVKAELLKVGSDYRGEIHFASPHRALIVRGFRLFTGPEREESYFLDCQPYHAGPTDLLTLDLVISETGDVMRQLKTMGLSLE